MNENQKGEDFSSPADHSPTLSLQAIESEKKRGTICPNCGAPLEGRKCKLICPRPGCGYLVTCSEW
ncbi:MAG: hypothetical protein KY445_13460 [Armatimonadetes bacterium]|nr:hypothetical protein [Armatimonadota bacterium]